MEPFALLSLTLTTAAVFAWVNHRFIRLPSTIGVMLVSLGMSLGLHLLALAGLDVVTTSSRLLAELDFEHVLMDIMLAFLLFAGSLHVQLDDLLGQKGVISLLATAGVLVTTFLVGGMMWLLTGALDLSVDFLPCLLFGALIAPTDPIAVMGILKTAGAPKSLETKIAGESLFNDGIAVVVFSVLLSLVTSGGGEHGGHGAFSGADVALLVGQEVVGSILLGLAGGWVAYRMLRSIDGYQVEVLLTLALCMGLYSLAASLHTSGPLAVVVAGLFIGNTGRTYGMSAKTRQHLDTFWELIDEILNVLLFVLIGMEVLLLSFPRAHLLAGLAAIPLVLAARFLSVGAAVSLLRTRRAFTAHAIKLLTWGGLRGGISIALALALPASLPARGLFVTVTYVVVVFSIVVQGLTIGPLVRRLLPAGEARQGH